VIYFDTMFRAPVKRDVNRMEGFRRAASYDLLDEEILTLALHIARKRIIVKERPFSLLFQNSLFSSIYSHQGQSTAYGVIDV
jgi:16S rRNA (guanine1516-N2)-methyltransferase